MSNLRKCVFSCDNSRTVFSLPKVEGPKRRLWLDFLGPVETGQVLFLCDRHFDDNSFLNLSLYKSGFSQRLILKSGAVPSIKPGTDKSKKESVLSEHSGNGLDAEPFVVPRMKTHGVQTLPTTVTGRTVSTQIAARFFKSRATQVTGASIDLNIQRHLYGHHLSPTKKEDLVPAPRPPKRPRLEEDEEDEREEEGEEENAENTENAEDLDDSDVSFEDSAPDSWTSATGEPELTKVNSADLEDTKYLVFESRLKELFDFCPVCQHPCMVQRRRRGTFVSFAQDCPHCLYSRQWQSQPVIGSTPAGDLQLSAAVYFSGGSFPKVKRMCKAMNLQMHKHDSFRRHCRSLLEPSVIHKWKTEQDGFVEELKRKGGVGVSCEMTVDSLGQFGSYTTTELQSNRILDMQLVQRRALGGRTQMEKEGLSRGLDFLKSSGLKVNQIVTDRHPEIKKYLCESGITQNNNSEQCQKVASNRRDLGDVKNLSSDRQTSFEARQRIICNFLSRKFVFREVSKMCSLYLAGMHHNENAKREQDASEQKVFFTELTTAKEAKTKPTFDYATSLMRLAFTEVLFDPSRFVEEQKFEELLLTL